MHSKLTVVNNDNVDDDKQSSFGDDITSNDEMKEGDESPAK